MLRRRVWALLIVIATVAAGALLVPSAAERFQHRRDVDAYQDYVVSYMLHPGTAADKDWAVSHPDEVLTEGNRACTWLSQRPSAPDIDPSGAHSVHDLSNAYLQSARASETSPLTREGHRRLVVGAWAYLCWSERRDKSAPMSEDED